MIGTTVSRYKILSELGGGGVGVVVDHPMDPGSAARIAALQESAPRRQLDGLVAEASLLTPAAILVLLAE